MLFNSYAFLFAFLPIVLAGFAVLVRGRSPRAVLAFLFAASLFFYGWWRWEYIGLLVASIVFNYACARRLAPPGGGDGRGRRALLAVGITANLASLGYFKYVDFFAQTLAPILGQTWEVTRIELPLGISFFTFHQIAYLVDTYRGQVPPHGPLPYALFIAFFPHLIAGPIVRARQLLVQFLDPRALRLEADNVATGLFILAIGLFKKVVIADTFGRYADPIFDEMAMVSFSDAWGAALAFTLQLYFDFSGYADMAIGLARLFNVELPESFDSPYQARSMIDFWRRWNITLSTFLRDYLYLPLGGNRGGPLRHYVNLFVIMVVCGLWHGAGWTFLLFGAIQGAYLVINHLWRRTRLALPGGAAWALTFLVFGASLVVFRAASFARLQVMLSGMAGLSGFAWDSVPYAIGEHELKRLLPGLALVLFAPNRQTIMRWQWRSDPLYALTFALLAAVSVLRLGDPRPFVYFQF